MTDLSVHLDDAAAEAKRRGHGLVTPAHLAFVLGTRYGPETAAVWPMDVFERAERILAAMPVVYDTPVVAPETELLLPVLRSGDLTAILSAVADALGAQARSGAGEQPGIAIPGAHHGWVSEMMPDPSVESREDVVAQILDAFDRHQAAPVLLVGEEGSGRTSVGAALATRAQSVVRVDSGAAPAQERLAAVGEMLRLAQGRGVVMVDDLEIALGLGYPGGFNSGLLDVLRPSIASQATRLLLVVARPYLERLRGTDRELVDELVTVHLPPLPPDVMRRVVATRARGIAEYHHVAIGATVVAASLAPQEGGDVDSHPALALRRLDVAAVRAARRGEGQEVTADDLPLTPAVPRRVDPTSLSAALAAQIVGQEAAIARVAARLAITVAELDLNPHRPDGVFLFAGPTGVGKTALALALATELFGSSDAVVRIDMSELNESHTSAKLVGAPPGYIGYDQPEGWLTTQIRASPRCVLLLDEVEKADPQVWNTFLQVFDAGRLTDLRGMTADFHEVVIVMTTNLGAEVFSPTGRAGFVDPASSSGTADAAAVLEVLKRAMRPELINRIDEVLVFSPLSAEAVHAIAVMRTDAAVATLRTRGYDVSATPELLALVERRGFSREYGGREVLRTVERLVLEPLAALPPGSYRPVVAGEEVGWVVV